MGSGQLRGHTSADRLLPALDVRWLSRHDGPLNGLMACIQMIAKQTCRLRSLIEQVLAAVQKIGFFPVREYILQVVRRAINGSLLKTFMTRAVHILKALTHIVLCRLQLTHEFKYKPTLPWRVVIKCPISGLEQEAAQFEVSKQPSYPTGPEPLIEESQRMQGTFD